MQFKHKREFENNVCIIQIWTGFTEDEELRLLKYGEPKINVGGSFSDGGSIAFNLPDEYKEIKSEFPIELRRDLRDHVNAVAESILWQDTIKARLDVEALSLNSKIDNFTSQGEETL